MIKKFLLFCLFSIAFSVKIWAQAEADSVSQSHLFQNSIYGELGGNAVLGSLNYERLFHIPAGKQTISVRVGGLLIPQGKDLGRFEYDLMIPAELTLISGRRAVRLEVGMGMTYLERSDTQFGVSGPETDRFIMVLPTFRVGGRWQYEDLPFFFRAGLTALFFGEDNHDFLFPAITPWPSFSWGYNFGKK